MMHVATRGALRVNQTAGETKMTGPEKQVTPYEVGTTDSPDEYVVWGRDEAGADYRAHVIVADCITPRDNKNLMALAIDNDSWTPFPNSYHGDISTDEPLELVHFRQLEAMLDSDTKVSEILDSLARICDRRGNPTRAADDPLGPPTELWWIAQVHIYHAARLIELAEEGL